MSEQPPCDDHGNARPGLSVLVGAHDNLVLNHGDGSHLVAALGLNGSVVVHTPQVTLVCPSSKAGRVKELFGEVTEKLGPSGAEPSVREAPPPPAAQSFNSSEASPRLQ